MNLKFLFLWILLFVQLNFFAQNVVGFHEVQKGIQEHEYFIKTTVTGLKNVDIAKLVVEIDSLCHFKKSVNNPYFFDRKGQEVKFYIIGIPPSGEISIEFSVELLESRDFNFPVRFQYSKNEEKQQLDLLSLKISNLPLFAVETTNKQEQEQKKIAKEKELQQKLEEEKLAKNIARFNAEQEEKKKQEELAAKIEQEKLLSEQKQKEEQEAKRMAEEKAYQQNLEAEKLAKAEADRQAKLKQEKILAEEKTKELTVTKNNVTPTKQYSVQLLSLANFSEERLKAYCNKHKLSRDKIVKRQIGNLMKISYGKVSSQESALELQQKLKQEHQIESSFIVVL